MSERQIYLFIYRPTNVKSSAAPVKPDTVENSAISNAKDPRDGWKELQRDGQISICRIFAVPGRATAKNINCQRGDCCPHYSSGKEMGINDGCCIFWEADSSSFHVALADQSYAREAWDTPKAIWMKIKLLRPLFCGAHRHYIPVTDFLKCTRPCLREISVAFSRVPPWAGGTPVDKCNLKERSDVQACLSPWNKGSHFHRSKDSSSRKIDIQLCCGLCSMAA